MTKGEVVVAAMGAVTLCVLLHLTFRSSSAEDLNLIYNNRKEFMIRLEIDQEKVSCYKEPQWNSEHCDAITSKGFPVQFSCNKQLCEFMR